MKLEETNTYELTQASKLRRALAYFVDTFILAMSLAMGLCLLFSGGIDTDPLESTSLLFLISFTIIPVAFLIFICKDFVKGISLGRWIMGIMVRDFHDHKKIPQKWKLMIRNMLLVVWPIELLVMMLSKSKQRLGDKIAKTLVLNNPSKVKKVYLLPTLALLFLVVCAAPMIVVVNGLKSSSAYQTAVQAIESDDNIKKLTGGILNYGLLPTGNIKIINGHGLAAFQIKVIGKDKDFDVVVILERIDGSEWKVVKYQY